MPSSPSPISTASASPGARRTIAGCALVASIAAALSACGGGTLKNNDASVRLLNASTEYATVDLLNDNSGIATGVAGYAASGYTDVNPGTVPLALRVPGSGVNAATLSLALSKDTHTTVVAYNSGAGVGLLSIAEDDSAPTSGKARLRLLNTASAEAGGLDIYLVPTSTACDALPAATPAAATNLTLGAATTAEVAAAGGTGTAYNLCVLATGDKTDVRLAISGVTLKDQQVSTVVLARTAGGVLVDALQLDQQGSLTVRRNTSARVRVVAALPAAGPVTASANGTAGGSTVLTADLASPSVGTYRLVAAGDLGLRVNGGAIAATVAAGRNATVLVRGTTAADITVIDDAAAPSTSISQPVKLKLINGSTTSVTLIVDTTVLGQAVAPGGASAAFNLASSASTAAISVSPAVAAALTTQKLEAGKVYSLFLLNDAAGVPTLTLNSNR